MSNNTAELTPDLKYQITKDWLSAFPGMGPYRPMWLMRRVGPLLMGLRLEADSLDKRYGVIFHTHVLSTRVISVGFSLPVRLQTSHGTEASISIRRHANHWEAAAHAAKEMTPLSFEGDLTLREVTKAYTDFMQEHPAEKRHLHNHESLIVLASWCGLTEQAQMHVEDGRRAIKLWPESERKKQKDLFNFDEEEWFSEQSELVHSPQLVRERVEQAIARDRKLNKLPVSQLIPG